jgi:hypothetical protein
VLRFRMLKTLVIVIFFGTGFLFGEHDAFAHTGWNSEERGRERGPAGWSCNEMRYGGVDSKTLSILRNEIYARRGRPFKNSKIRELFLSHDWYKVNPNYSDSMLTADDLACIRVIRNLEKSPPGYFLYDIDLHTNPSGHLDLDFDGDGIKERFLWEKVGNGDLRIQIGDAVSDVSGDTSHCAGLLKIVQIDQKSSTKQIYTSTCGYDPVFYSLLTYDGKRMYRHDVLPIYDLDGKGYVLSRGGDPDAYCYSSSTVVYQLSGASFKEVFRKTKVDEERAEFFRAMGGCP